MTGRGRRWAHSDLISNTQAELGEMLAGEFDVEELTIIQLDGESGNGPGGKEVLDAGEGVGGGIEFRREKHLDFVGADVA